MSSSANFLIKKDDSFTVVIPVSVVDPEEPACIFASSIEQYPEELQKIPEDKIEYHFCKFKKPDWGEDCLCRELAHTATGTTGTLQDRYFSQQKFQEIRIRYLLLETSVIPERLATHKVGVYDTLTPDSEAKVKSIQPYILSLFLLIASRIWDLGLPARHLLSEADYKLLRNDPEGLVKVVKSKGMEVSTEDEEAKKKSTTTSSIASSLPDSLQTTPGSPSA